jgi:hypothetical protein
MSIKKGPCEGAYEVWQLLQVEENGQQRPQYKGN